MKKIFYSILATATMISLAACSEDNSTLPDESSVSDISIDDLTDGTTIEIVSYEGNKLELTPTVHSTYSDSELSYEWYIYDEGKASTMDMSTSKYNMDKTLISTEKNLSYEVNLKPAAYVVELCVTAENGIKKYATADLQTNTNFTEGFYILKQTPEGNSDLDKYSIKSESSSENIIQMIEGASLSGKPRNLTICFNHGWIDPDDEVSEECGTLIAVSTENNVFHGYRPADMSLVKTNDNIFYGPSDAQLYQICPGMWTCNLVSSEGVSAGYAAGMYGGTGTYGLPAGTGGSEFTVMKSQACLIQWDAVNHRFFYMDYNGGSHSFINADLPTEDLTDLNCIGCGENRVASRAWFLLENSSTKERKLYLFSGSFSAAINSIVDVPAGTHLATATKFATSNYSASVIYCIEDGKVYTYDLSTGDENQITFAGVDKVDYLTSNWWGATEPSREYLIAGTQSGNQYTLKFYNILGGKPDGDAIATFSGTGIVKSVRYTTPYQSMYIFSGTFMQNIND